MGWGLLCRHLAPAWPRDLLALPDAIVFKVFVTSSLLQAWSLRSLPNARTWGLRFPPPSTPTPDLAARIAADLGTGLVKMQPVGLTGSAGLSRRLCWSRLSRLVFLPCSLGHHISFEFTLRKQNEIRDLNKAGGEATSLREHRRPT